MLKFTKRLLFYDQFKDLNLIILRLNVESLIALIDTMKMKDKGFSNNSKNHRKFSLFFLKIDCLFHFLADHLIFFNVVSQGATNYQAAGRSTNHSVQNSINVVSDVEMPPLEQIPLSLRVHFGLTDEVESNPANNDLKNEDLVLSDSENGQIEIEVTKKIPSFLACFRVLCFF